MDSSKKRDCSAEKCADGKPLDKYDFEEERDERKKCLKLGDLEEKSQIPWKIWKVQIYGSKYNAHGS